MKRQRQILPSAPEQSAESLEFCPSSVLSGTASHVSRRVLSAVCVCVCVIAAHQPVHLFDVGLNRLTPPLTTPSSLLHTAEKCRFKNDTSVT